MNNIFTLPLDDRSSSLEMVGGKGASLTKMVAAELPVPEGYHITTSAYRLFVAENGLQPRIMEILKKVNYNDPESLEKASQEINKQFSKSVIPEGIARAIVQAYNLLPGISPAVAVRSSATAEDLPQASFAGQQDTYLNVSGEDALLEATRKCWASLWTARAIGYRARQDIPAESAALAVVVQLLVPAQAAGIMFTANPLNGARDQIVINASWGLGEAVVGGLVTPDSLTIDKNTGKIISRKTAEKLLQTVRVNGSTEERPVPENLKQVPVLSDSETQELARLGEEIESLYKMPMDIEWALADGKFFIVQARPITALPEPDPPIPAEWKLPEGAYAAMRNNIVELMTEPLSPLFKTLGLNAVNRSMGGLLSGFFGNQDVMPGELIITVNDYAYYNGSVKFIPMMKIILDTPGIMRRMFTGAVERWTETGRPEYVSIVSRWQTSTWIELPSGELIKAISQLTEAAIDAYGSLVSGVLPAAWISEAWFSLIYRLVKRAADPSAPTFLMGFDSLPIRADKSLFDISRWVLEHDGLSAYLKTTAATDLAAQLNVEQMPLEVGESEWREWRQRFHAHLRVFGHTIYNLDFANPVPADDPAPMLETLKMYLAGQGVDPYTRQKTSAERRERAIQAMRKKLKGMRLKLFNKNLERAQRYAPLREDGLADVGLSYPIIRQMIFELGKRFTVAGVIQRVDDIFWLQQAEIEDVAARLDRGEQVESLAEFIPRRKARLRSAERATPPMALPQIKVFGVDVLSKRSAKDGDQRLRGVAASPGSVTAVANILHGPEDFSKMRTGDVLVASITTPAWTPLFARAAAVVTDIGGPLSHGSIVAREYGIPAVLGTDSATKQIQDGQMITVDGDSGLVTLIGD